MTSFEKNTKIMGIVIISGIVTVIPIILCIIISPSSWPFLITHVALMFYVTFSEIFEILYEDNAINSRIPKIL